MERFESAQDAFEGELWGEVSSGSGGFGEGEAPVFDEVEEMELAGTLLEVSTDQELDQFLGNLVRRAGRAVGAAVRSPVGQALGGILRNAARQALPVVGGAIGSAIAGPSGGTVGSRVATRAGQIFGLELEGLSDEDQEYELARRFVRFAGDAAANAARVGDAGAPASVAQRAAVAAARRHAPGLLGAAGRPGRRAAQGRWVRRGRNIVVLNGD